MSADIVTNANPDRAPILAVTADSSTGSGQVQLSIPIPAQVLILMLSLASDVSASPSSDQVERDCFSAPSNQCSNFPEILIRLHDNRHRPASQTRDSTNAAAYEPDKSRPTVYTHTCFVTRQLSRRCYSVKMSYHGSYNVCVELHPYKKKNFCQEQGHLDRRRGRVVD
ncbi:hypothetical protein EVAR_16381_1 [Eumeta japonica]|uniref:Uncharacterized protein n=1 Tax=Eumeta variegata TaxID=151549 RepID=A0A4C1VWS2_EUMVA|nr:hypothetical protein EVAR_16381_1 [Eumeta japonica]